MIQPATACLVTLWARATVVEESKHRVEGFTEYCFSHKYWHVRQNEQ